MLDKIFITSIMAVHIHLGWSLILMFIFITFIVYCHTNVLQLYYLCFLYKNNFKKIENLLHRISMIPVRNCTFFLVYWNKIISLFLKVLCKLLCEAYWICCLLICRDQNKKNVTYCSFFYLWQNYVDNAASCGKHDT